MNGHKTEACPWGQLWKLPTAPPHLYVLKHVQLHMPKAESTTPHSQLPSSPPPAVGQFCYNSIIICPVEFSSTNLDWLSALWQVLRTSKWNIILFPFRTYLLEKGDKQFQCMSRRQAKKRKGISDGRKRMSKGVRGYARNYKAIRY